MNAAHVPCGHCGLPVRRAVPASGDGPFCCTGCELAWHFGDAGEGGSDRWIARIVLSAFLAMGVMVASLALYGRYLGEDGLAQSTGAIALRDIYRTGALLLCLPILHLLGVPLLGAVRASRRFLSADFLVLCGVGAAFSLSIWNTVMGRGEVYYETVAMVLVLVSLGRWLDARAKAKASAHLALIAPEAIASVTRIDMSGESSIAYEELQVGDSIRVRPGETLPVDGLVLRGETTLDTSSLTGEWLPRRVAKGDRVLAGCEVLDGTLVVRAEAVGAGRVQAEVERLLRAALDRPAHFVKLADRVAAVLLPIVFVLATGTLIWNLRLGRVEEGWMNALSVVLISCPCALGIATPLAYWTALREAWERGVLVKNADVLERLARTEQVVFDKTGTLTSSAADLIRIHEPSCLMRTASVWSQAAESRRGFRVSGTVSFARPERRRARGRSLHSSAKERFWPSSCLRHGYSQPRAWRSSRSGDADCAYT